MKSLAGIPITDHIDGQFIPLHGIMRDVPDSASVYHPNLVAMDGYVALYPTSNAAYCLTALLKKGGTLEPKALWTTYSFYDHGFVHSDIFVGYVSGSGQYGMNLREDGLARNVGGSAGNKVIPMAQYGIQNGYGMSTIGFTGSLNGSAVPASGGGQVLHEDARYLIPAHTEDTSYPTVSSPSAPTCVAGTSGGKLADGTYEVKLTWVTKRNPQKTGHGFTVASTATQSTVTGGSGNGKIDVTIPALPTNVIGYAVSIGAVGGPHYVCGGNGIGSTTHTIKATMTQLAMKNRVFYNGSSLQQGIIGNLEGSNPITVGTVRATTANNRQTLWSPFFKDPTQLYVMPYGYNAASQYNADKFDILAETIALNATVETTGEPAFLAYQQSSPAGFINFRSIPEMGAYAIIHPGNTSSYLPAYVQVRSCFNNAILWMWASDDLMPANIQVLDMRQCPVDFETIDGITYMMYASMKLRGIMRYPVRVTG